MIRVALTLFLLTISAQIASAAEKPNVILLMGDDHGWEETGYYDHPFVKTPVLDEMAAGGLRLDNFYAGHPTCSPTRASFLTGRHPNRMGTFTPGFSLRPDEISIAHIMSKAGYATAHFGKWHVGPVKASSPTNPAVMGFDHYLSHDNFFELDPIMSLNGAPPQKHPGESSEILIDHTIQFIDQATAQDKPFFIVVWYGSPHEPYSGLEKDLALYEDLPAQYAELMPKYRSKKVKLTSNETGEQVRRLLTDVLQERYAEITALDRSLGTLRDHLQANQLRDNTLLWYCGDNGTPRDSYSGLSPLRGMKAMMYEGGIRVPGVIEWPAKITEPMVSTVSTVTSDMLPTLCAITGQPLPDRPLDGTNILPVIEGDMTIRPEPLEFWSVDTRQFAQRKPEPYFTAEQQQGTTPLVKKMHGIATRNFQNFVYPKINEQDYAGTRVIIDGDHKLILSGAADDYKTELYNLKTDRAEQSNLADDSPERVKELSQKLQTWQHSVLESLTGTDYE